MLPMVLFDCRGHQLQNEFFAAEFWKKNPVCVSTQLTMRKYVGVYSVSVYSVLNVAIVWSFEGECDDKCDCNISSTSV